MADKQVETILYHLIMCCDINLVRSAVAHVISQFVAMSLDGSLTTKPSANVTLAYLFVCRQLYKTGEGLMTLLQYNLHNLIAVAWRMVCMQWEYICIHVFHYIIKYEILSSKRSIGPSKY